MRKNLHNVDFDAKSEYWNTRKGSIQHTRILNDVGVVNHESGQQTAVKTGKEAKIV